MYDPYPMTHILALERNNVNVLKTDDSFVPLDVGLYSNYSLKIFNHIVYLKSVPGKMEAFTLRLYLFFKNNSEHFSPGLQYSICVIKKTGRKGQKSILSKFS